MTQVKQVWIPFASEHNSSGCNYSQKLRATQSEADLVYLLKLITEGDS